MVHLPAVRRACDFSSGASSRKMSLGTRHNRDSDTQE